MFVSHPECGPLPAGASPSPAQTQASASGSFPSPEQPPHQCACLETRPPHLSVCPALSSPTGDTIKVVSCTLPPLSSSVARNNHKSSRRDSSDGLTELEASGQNLLPICPACCGYRHHRPHHSQNAQRTTSASVTSSVPSHLLLYAQPHRSLLDAEEFPPPPRPVRLHQAMYLLWPHTVPA